MRSTSHQLLVAPGPAASAQLQAAGADQEQFSISNGSEAAARRLLRNAAVQLVDGFGNAAAVSDVPLRWQLTCAAAAQDDAQAPQLCCSAADGAQLQSDERGRAFFGDIAVEEGSGRLVSGSCMVLASPSHLPGGASGPEDCSGDPPAHAHCPVPACRAKAVLGRGLSAGWSCRRSCRALVVAAAAAAPTARPGRRCGSALCFSRTTRPASVACRWGAGKEAAGASTMRR